MIFNVIYAKKKETCQNKLILSLIKTMQYASAPYVITEEEDSKDKKVGKAKNLSRYLTEKCKIWGVGRYFTPSSKG